MLLIEWGRAYFFTPYNSDRYIGWIRPVYVPYPPYTQNVYSIPSIRVHGIRQRELRRTKAIFPGDFRELKRKRAICEGMKERERESSISLCCIYTRTYTNNRLLTRRIEGFLSIPFPFLYFFFFFLHLVFSFKK